MINITRTAASTEEQVITSKRAKLLGFVPELVTTGTIDLRDEGSAKVVDTVANIAAAAAAGGSLADDTWFINVVAVDADGNESAEGTEDSAATATTNNTVAVTWDAPTTGATPASFRVYIGTATGVYDGYFTAAAGAVALSITSVAAYDGTGDGPGTTSASSDANLKHHAAIGVLQAGKDLQAAQFSKGITVRQSVSTDRMAVLWEALTG